MKIRVNFESESETSKMRRVTFEEYLEYTRRKGEIEIGGVRIKLEPIKVKRLHPTREELTDVSTTVWSFPKRGSWGTHRGDYRGNWPPQVPRSLMLMYTRRGDTVLDPMVGSGTTCIEAKLLGRNCIGVDINYDAVILTLHRLYWLEKHLEKIASAAGDLRVRVPGVGAGDEESVSVDEMLGARVEIYHGDARSLDGLQDESVDLVALHPPYYSIIRYSGGKRVPGDLSVAGSLEEYLDMMYQVGREVFRVLRPGRFMGVLVGDTRVRKHYVPLTHYVLRVLLRAGFIVREEVVKIQHRMRVTRGKWVKLGRRDFLLIYHEKLFILRKSVYPDEYGRYRYSSYMED